MCEVLMGYMERLPRGCFVGPAVSHYAPDGTFIVGKLDSRGVLQGVASGLTPEAAIANALAVLADA